MGSVNKVILVGNLGRDAEVRFTPGGSPVASFSIATTENWTSKDGQKQEKTEWHRIVLWGKQAETLQPYLTKGKQIYLEGRLETRSWEKDGQKHNTTEVKADKIVLLGVLIGLGLTEFSMTPGALPVARQVVRDMRAEDARTLARDVLRLSTAAEVEQYLFDALAASAGQVKTRG